MVITQYFTTVDKHGNAWKVHNVMHDGDIHSDNSGAISKVHSAADGGIVIRVDNSDANNNGEVIRIHITKEDMDRIQSLKNQGLI